MNATPANVIAAFSEDHTSRLTGVTKSQLRHWDRTGFFVPSYADQNRRVAFSRVYSFKDLASLRVLNALRNQFSVPLQHLRQVSARLNHLADDKWTGTRLYVLNRKVIWQEPGTQKPQEVASQQYVVNIDLSDVLSATQQDVAVFNKRDPSQIGVITRSRNVGHNMPVLAGTRIPVSAIKSFGDAGYQPAQIVAEYPDLTEKDVKAALAYDESKAA